MTTDPKTGQNILLVLQGGARWAPIRLASTSRSDRRLWTPRLGALGHPSERARG
jgi:hypothetical protein